MKEPTKFSMSTGQPLPEEEGKRPLPSIEQELFVFIEEGKRWSKMQVDIPDKE